VRLVVVGFPADADPVLPEIDAGDLTAGEGLADMGAEVADAWNGAQFLARAGLDAQLLGKRCAWGVTQCIMKSRSLNDGISDWPSNGQTPIPASVTTPTVIKAARGVRVARSSKGA
jgi:hypothetical protein